MNYRIKDITGQRFGRLVTIRHIGSNANRVALWECVCDCGQTAIANLQSLRRGNTKSCGCLAIEHGQAMNRKHGSYRSPAYRSWQRMRARCLNPNHKHFANYGGRGVTVCERWNSFENFLADMGERPEGMTLERIDNSKGYSPDNCRWATRKEQQNNMRRNRILELNGERLNMTQWATRLGVTRKFLERRIDQLRWSVERALTEPRRKLNV